MKRQSVPLVLAVLLLAGCGARGDSGEAPPAAASMTVTVIDAGERTLARDIVASGSVAAWQEMVLGVELTGIRVARVNVEVGDRVKAGEALLQLDARTLDVAARQAAAGLAQAKASLEQARAAANRGASLVEQNLISTSDSEELRANLSRAEAQVSSAEAERDAARLRLGFATLRAPDAGVISARSVQPGQIVNAGNELLRMIRRGRLEWQAEVSDADLGRVKVGATVELLTPDGATVQGKVRAVSPSIDVQRRTALIYADLPEPGQLRAGMFAQGRIVLGKTAVLAIPRASVVSRDGFKYVFQVGDDARVRQLRIDTGESQGDFIEVRAGLNAGQTIVLRGAGFLSDGDTVRIVTEED